MLVGPRVCVWSERGELHVRHGADEVVRGGIVHVRVGECGGCAEVHADTVFQAVCEALVDLSDGGGGDFPGEGGEGVYVVDEVGVEEPEDADELCDA